MDFDDIDLDNVPYFNTECHAPVSANEISKVISNLKNTKACSMNDHALNKYFKCSKDATHLLLVI